MKDLFEKIANYKTACQSLINKIEQYERDIKENIPFELWGDFGLGAFRGNQREDWYVKIDGKFVPSTPDEFKQEKYWAGDFNHPYKAVTTEELLEWAKELPGLMANMEAWIEKKTKEIEIIAA